MNNYYISIHGKYAEELVNDSDKKFIFIITGCSTETNIYSGILSVEDQDTLLYLTIKYEFTFLTKP